MDCTVCLDRRDGFVDGPRYPLHQATHQGLNLDMGKIEVYAWHKDWVTDDWPETLRPLD